jgi:hypothetical protein
LPEFKLGCQRSFSGEIIVEWRTGEQPNRVAVEHRERVGLLFEGSKTPGYETRIQA